MNQTTADDRSMPAIDEFDPAVLTFNAQFKHQRPFDELVRTGAQRVLQAAIDAEVNAFLETHEDRRDEQGRLNP